MQRSHPDGATARRRNLARHPALAIGVVALASIITAVGHTHAATGARPFDIGPGPSEMTPEEKALLPDVSAGAQHAIVLIDDTVRDDSKREFGRHIRVKLLSGRWRGIGNIEIPVDRPSELKKWWAHVIPLEGPPIEIDKDALTRHVVARRGGRRLRVLKVALPRVEPGSVLDLGYLMESGGSVFDKIELQQPWRVRHLRYFWAPTQWIASQYNILKRPGVDVAISRKGGGVLLEGTDLPVYHDEPWSPPDDVVRAAAVFHYTFDQPNADPNAFWSDVARRQEETIKTFLEDDKELAPVIKTITASGDTLDARLRAAYDWINRNVRNVSTMTSEELEDLGIRLEQSREKEKTSAWKYHRKPGTIGDILENHEAMSDVIDRLFAGIARELGATAELVLATDREFELWNRTLFTQYQFSMQLVAVRAPGEPIEKAVLVDPGSGLPYGVVDWRVTATRALLSTSRGAVELTIPPQKAADNVLSTTARIRYDHDANGASVVWSAAGTGQRGREEHAQVRSASPDERDDLIRRLCGEGAGMEVVASRSTGWEVSSSPFALECEVDLADPGPAPGQSAYSARFEGPWVPRVPKLLSPERINPIVFDYPREDHTTIEVNAPEGFAPVAAPAPVKLGTPFGDYSLDIRLTESGYTVERHLVMTTLTALAESYRGLRRFLQNVRRADTMSLRFRRVETGS